MDGCLLVFFGFFSILRCTEPESWSLGDSGFFFGSQNPNRERERERVCGSWVSKEEERRRNGESTLWLRQVVVRRFVRHARRAPRRPIILSTADDVDVGDGRSRKSPAPNRLSDGLFGPSRFPQFFLLRFSSRYLANR